MYTWPPATFGFLLSALLASPAGGAVPPVHTVQVMVSNAANMAPLDGATVCIGTADDPDASGRRTTTNGRATFNVGTGNWLVTAWRSGFTVGHARVSVTRTTKTVRAGIVLRSTTEPTTNPCGAP